MCSGGGMTFLMTGIMNKDKQDDNDDIKGELISPQRSGRAIDAEATAWLSAEKTASVFYELVRNRMQHVNSWAVIAGNLFAEFQLVTKEGLEVFRKAQEGDYLRISVMGPDGKSGDTYDWVRIEEVNDDVEGDRFSFRVRPANHPSAHRGVPDKLYDRGSMSTFQVLREGRRVTVTISDRDERSDRDVAYGEKVRNHIVTWAALTRFSGIPWQTLAEGLVSR